MSSFHIKSQIRVLGIDDSALIDDRILVVGAFFRGGEWLDGVVSTYITRDGMDATDSLIKLALNSKHHEQIRVIMLDGVTYGGFNPVDIVELSQKSGSGVIVLMRSLPDLERMRIAASHLPFPKERMNLILKAGEIKEVVTKESENPIFIQCSGIEMGKAIEVVKLTATHSNIPEPLRVAHLIATGIVCGESCGRV
ncbi:DUF99 family protein [Methanohalophilus sp.]|uniref:endonuclease dU n=1 Tax=Methanohalophilus sp. TaxID=1966352 RepID=UPI002624DC71|nr:DUF99 family protein [Methanohalophilus sp.]MDK2891630.1 uncharacterized protein [Methanohalophilus sp.]